jgi:hypothetical protein
MSELPVSEKIVYSISLYPNRNQRIWGLSVIKKTTIDSDFNKIDRINVISATQVRYWSIPKKLDELKSEFIKEHLKKPACIVFNLPSSDVTKIVKHDIRVVNNRQTLKQMIDYLNQYKDDIDNFNEINKIIQLNTQRISIVTKSKIQGIYCISKRPHILNK